MTAPTSTPLLATDIPPEIPTEIPVPTKTNLPPTPDLETMELTSTAFKGGFIPSLYSCQSIADTSGFSPPLSWASSPEETKSFAIINDDIDWFDGDSVFNHWLIYDIPPDVFSLNEGIPPDLELPDGSRQGKNSVPYIGYAGPCPALGVIHRYVFTIYALDTVLDLEAGVRKGDLLLAMEGHVLATGHITVKFKGDENLP